MRVIGEAATVAGGCHCGAVRFSVDLPEGWLPHLCDCSLCGMKGSVLIDLPLDALEVTEGEEHLTLYTCNTGVAKHRFCSTCGIHPFHQLRSDPTKFGVNAVCLDGFNRYDFAELPVNDGQNHPKDRDGVRRWAGVVRFERDG